MFLVDESTVFKFGVKKEGRQYLPYIIEDESTIKEGQVIFETKAYTSKEVLKFNNMKDEVKRFEFILARTKCNVSMDRMIPSIIESVNWLTMGLSVSNEDDEKLFM